MKLKLTISIFLLSVCFAFSQDLTDKKITLLQLSYLSQGSILNGLDKYEPATSREKKKYNEIQEELKVTLQNFFFEELQKSIESKSLSLEPTNALENYGVMYANGYPLVLTVKSGVKKAQKKGYSSDYYMNAKLFTTVDTGLMSSSSKTVNKFVGEAEVTIDIVGTDGKKIKTVKYKESNPEKITNKDYFGGRFDKTDSDDIERLLELFQPLVGIATQKAVEQL